MIKTTNKFSPERPSLLLLQDPDDLRFRDGPVFGFGVIAREEGVLAVQGDGADLALVGFAFELDAVICQETTQAVAVFRDICQCLIEG